MLRFFLLTAALALPLSTILAKAQSPVNTAPVAPNASQDRSVDVVSRGSAAAAIASLDRHIAPAVKQARKTLPQAKQRFLSGLPAGQAFFLTTRVKDPDGTFEQVFVRVTEWQERQVQGTIASEPDLVKNYRLKQVISFPESAILDWTISHPDGSEEGNYVGKLLDAGTN